MALLELELANALASGELRLDLKARQMDRVHVCCKRQEREVDAA